MVNTFYVIANRELPMWVAEQSRTYYNMPDDAFATYEQAAELLKISPNDYGKDSIVFEVRPAVVML